MTTRKAEGIALRRDGFCYDPDEAARHLRSADPVLAKLMERAGPFALEIRKLHDPFEALARNIVFQQLHGKAAEAIHARVLALFGGAKLRPEDILGATDEAMRGAGVFGGGVQPRCRAS